MAFEVLTSTDAFERVTRYEYDANARLTKTIYPDNTSESITYDANGNEETRTDRQNRLTRMVYDELDRHVRTIHPDASVESTVYDDAGRVQSRTTPAGTTSYEYDAADRMTASIDASGRRTEHTCDPNGNRQTTTLPSLGAGQPTRVIRYTYDDLNRLKRTDYPDGSLATINYRPDGRKSDETDARGVTTVYTYDPTGRLQTVRQSGITTATTYGYDEQGDKTLQRDALNHEVRWIPDPVARTATRVLPDGTRETHEHDLEGQLVAKTTFAGQRISSTYDAAGRERTRTIPATANTPARSIAWAYDEQGRRLTQTETGPTSLQGTTTWRYDAQGRPVEQAGPHGTLNWAYDSAGRITQRTTSEGTTRYEWDGDGRLTKLIAPDNKETVYTYDPAGRLARSEQTLSATIKLVTERRHDAMDRQIVVAHSKLEGGTTSLITGQHIHRGAGGAVSRIDTFDATATFSAGTGAFVGNPSRIQAFGYDANARLQSEKEFKGADIAAFLGNANARATKAITYGYDDAGNRTSKTLTTAAGTETTAYVYDSSDRLQTETLTTTTGSTVQTSYTWDGNGNMQSKTAPGDYTGYVFDANNRLIEVRKGASQATATLVASYGYDADGQRVRKTTPSDNTTTHFLIDPTTTWPQVVLEKAVTPSSTQHTAYVWGDQLRQQVRGGQGTLFGSPTENLIPVQGHLNTTIASLVPTAVAAESYELTSFGESGKLTPRVRHQYTDEYWDGESRTTYLRARWYDANTGRFIGADPIQGKPRDPLTLNRYAYGHNDPTHSTDPSGKESLLSLSTAFTALNVGVTSYLVTTDLMAGDYGAAATDLAFALVAGKVGSWVASSHLTEFVVKNMSWLTKFTRSTKTVTIYRAVGVREFESLMATKQFNWGPQPTMMKQFGFTLEEALAYANTSPSYVAIVKVTIDESAVALAHFSRTIDAHIFKNGVLTFGDESLAALNSAIKSISHVF